MRGRKRNLENRVFREQQQQKNKMFIPEFLSSQNMRSALRQWWELLLEKAELKCLWNTYLPSSFTFTGEMFASHMLLCLLQAPMEIVLTPTVASLILKADYPSVLQFCHQMANGGGEGRGGDGGRVSCHKDFLAEVQSLAFQFSALISDYNKGFFSWKKFSIWSLIFFLKISVCLYGWFVGIFLQYICSHCWILLVREVRWCILLLVLNTNM